MSGKLFDFLCSQLERKNSRRTIDLSVNLIFRRIHVYQNGHVPIYRFPSVFFLFFSQKEFFMLTNGTTYQTAKKRFSAKQKIAEEVRRTSVKRASTSGAKTFLSVLKCVLGCFIHNESTFLKHELYSVP